MKNNFFVTSAALDVPHGFLKRHGGVSQGIYDSLNCGYRHDRQGAGFDAEENVVENRRRAITFVGGSFKTYVLQSKFMAATVWL
ncbi:MAG: laccase domain-containing protein [Holosporaceae bacterium]|nr:MAG: laccase domain-containing protein [Holosporaceae bacterium]